MTTPISFTVRPPSAPNRPSPLGNGGWRNGPPSRRLFENGNGEDDEDEDGGPGRRGPRSDRHDGSGSRGSQRGGKADEPLVIPSLPNRDWRQNSQRRTPTYRPDGRQQLPEDMITHERTGDGPQKSGLRFNTKEEPDDDVKPKLEQDEDGATASLAPSGNGEVKVKAEPEEPLTLEQQALRALLAGDDNKESEEERAQRELVIRMEESKASEEDALKRDIAELPEVSTLEDYASVPVSAFGLAMARGMGYNPSSSSTSTIHEPKMRPQLLGLGATAMDTTIRPTHSRHGSTKKDKQKERAAKSGRGFVATSLLVKKEREGSGTPGVIESSNGGSSRITSRGVSPSSEGSRRRRREDDDVDSGRDVKKERSDDGYRDRRREREYETEEERARRKAKEREREYETEEERARRKAKEREREYETEEERAKRKAREREREYETEEERAKRKARERERYGNPNGDRDRDRGKGGDDRERGRR